MAIRSVDDASLTAVGDAIRAKGGTSEALVFPDGFVSAVEAIQAGAATGEDLFLANLHGSLARIESDAVTKVRDYCFRGYTILEYIRIPNCSGIGIEAFYGCTRLTEAIIPSVTELVTSSFSGCTALTEIDLTSCVSVGRFALRACSSLKKLDFPALSTMTYDSTFVNCTALETLIIRNTSKVVGLNNVNSLSGTPIESGAGYIYVPSELLDDYKVATNWVTYADQIRAIEDYPEICGEVTS